MLPLLVVLNCYLCADFLWFPAMRLDLSSHLLMEDWENTRSFRCCLWCLHVAYNQYLKKYIFFIGRQKARTFTPDNFFQATARYFFNFFGFFICATSSWILIGVTGYWRSVGQFMHSQPLVCEHDCTHNSFFKKTSFTLRITRACHDYCFGNKSHVIDISLKEPINYFNLKSRGTDSTILSF